MTTDRKFADERLKLSPFHDRQAALNLRDSWSVWNGYKFAEYYYDAEYEYFCVRNTCGTYDICPMQKYLIQGDNAEAMLNRMVTRDITKLQENRVTYVCWCTNEGRMIDDGTIFKLGPKKFMLTCGSPSLAWLKKASFGFDAVEIEDITDTLAALSFQGPTTFSVLKAMGLKGIEDLKPFQIGYFDFAESGLMISRTGFTGDLGYELWIQNKDALELWDKLYSIGEDYGIQPYGESATNMARLEAGFIMPYMEFNEALKTVHYQHDQTPFELNLGWLVDFNKPLFNGRKALLLDKKNGPKYTLTKLDIEGNKPAEGSYIYGDKKCSLEIGYVTSAMWSPAVKANIAMAMIETEHLQGEIWAEIYYEKELRQYDKVARCSIKEKPFWAPSRARMTPPENY
ncbi:MAG: aminomethyltransferase family protein [Woeseiaceae bacterium]|nr:aminomethyltransferase family protein [Woeseiaceae bacterium]|tara:strand:+ start:342 stop:1538 length:1197 start_codon:yes stop_codon:yes gene_type:complete